MEIVVWSGTPITTVAQLLADSGAGAATVVDDHGDRAGVATAQDVFEAARLGAGGEPVSRIVVWSRSVPTPVPRPRPRPPLRLVRRDTRSTAAMDAPEPLGLVESGRWR